MRAIFTTFLVGLSLLIWAGPYGRAETDASETLSYWSEEPPTGGSYLGVDTRDITPDRLGPLQIKEEQGVEVTMVDQDAPAGKAGIREHDVILSINGEQIESVEQLRRVIHEVPPGRTITLGISRAGQPLNMKVQVANRKEFTPSAHDFKLVMPMPAVAAMPEMDLPASVVVVHSSLRSGLMVENLSPQLADFFGAKEGKGILVRSVEKGSCAEKAGFTAGDVITGVNGRAVNDAGEFSQAVRNRKGSTVNIEILRGKRQQILTLTMPETKHSGEFDKPERSPDMGAELNKELEDMNSEIAQIQPEMDRAMAEVERLKPELEKEATEWSRQQVERSREWSKQMRQWREQQPGKQWQQQLRQLFGRRADI
jgi:serine protease Do